MGEVFDFSFDAFSFLPPIGGLSFMTGWIAVFWNG